MNENLQKYNTYIEKACDNMKTFLIEKNNSYNGSVFKDLIYNPNSNLTKVDTVICRLNDKLRRIVDNKKFKGDNDLKDLAGYILILEALQIIEEETVK